MTPAAYVLNRAVLKRLNQTENADNAIMQIPLYFIFLSWNSAVTAINWH